LPTIAPVLHPVWESERLARRSKLRIGPTCAIGAVTLVLCVGIALLYVGWQPGATLNLTGYVAMAVGLLAVILLGIGIVMLIHRDKHDR